MADPSPLIREQRPACPPRQRGGEPHVRAHTAIPTQHFRALSVYDDRIVSIFDAVAPTLPTKWFIKI